MAKVKSFMKVTRRKKNGRPRKSVVLSARAFEHLNESANILTLLSTILMVRGELHMRDYDDTLDIVRRKNSAARRRKK